VPTSEVLEHRCISNTVYNILFCNLTKEVMACFPGSRGSASMSYHYSE